MKNLNLLVYLFAFLLLALPNAEAQEIPRAKALAVLAKTNRAIQVAHVAVKRNKVYTGNLGKAVKNQRYAKKLFNEGKYAKAIHFSKRARVFAGEAMKANKAKANTDFGVTMEEDTIAGSAPKDQEMEEELKKENPTDIKDEELMNSNQLGIDVK
jgi:hypothetical protein